MIFFIKSFVIVKKKVFFNKVNIVFMIFKTLKNSSITKLNEFNGNFKKSL